MVAAADGPQRVVVRHRAAAARLHGEDRRQAQRIVSVATMEGVWFAYDAANGRPIYQRVKVIDPPSIRAQPGKPVAVYPVVARRPQLLAGVVRPDDQLRLQRRRRDGGARDQAKLTPTQKKRKSTARRRLPRARERRLRHVPSGLARPRLDQRDRHPHGQARLEVPTPEPERGGVTTTATGLGFAGGGDGILRAFDLKTGKVLWKFQTGRQIAAGASVYSVDGKEYIAITAGGTPTSSGGGTASQLQVFALGASQQRVAAADAAGVTRRAAAPRPCARRRATPPRRDGRSRSPRAARLGSHAAGGSSSGRGTRTRRTSRPSGPLLLTARRSPARASSVDGYASAAHGDERHLPLRRRQHLPRRHPSALRASAHATVHGQQADAAEQQARCVASLRGLQRRLRRRRPHARGRRRQRLVTGRCDDTARRRPRRTCYTYQLERHDHGRAGKPVEGAVVITRTQDRDFWTYSSATDASGHYSSFFAASDETAADPVPLAVGVASAARRTAASSARTHRSSGCRARR